jgi:hypothetical protein
VHVAPTCAGSRERFDHFGSYTHSISLHFCKRLFPGLEPMISRSQGNSFTTAAGLPFSKHFWKFKKKTILYHTICIRERKFELTCCVTNLRLHFWTIFKKVSHAISCSQSQIACVSYGTHGRFAQLKEAL